MTAPVFTQTLCVAGGILEKDGKILLVKEAKGLDKGKWNHPAGLVDVGEDPLDAARREVREETGYEFDWEEIQTNAKKLLFVHSDNDPYVPLDQAQYVADHCQAALDVIPGQGHFNLEQSPAYSSFPKLMELLKLKGLLR